MGSLNGNGNGNTLLNVDYYEGNGNGASVQSSSPLMLLLGTYINDVVNILKSAKNGAWFINLLLNLTPSNH